LKRVIILADAAEDIEAARDFYEAQERGVGENCGIPTRAASKRRLHVTQVAAAFRFNAFNDSANHAANTKV
jgi:hypothetical protein